MKTKVILHGECMIKSVDCLPQDVKPKQVNNGYVIVADSETTGNHHVVDVFEGVNIFEASDGSLYMQNSVPTKVRCVMADRHDAVELPAGNYHFGFQQEYDYFTEALRKVRD